MNKPTFDPNAAAQADSGIFGLPYTEEESSLIYLPVPWEVTTSYGGGTSRGPSAILKASRQVDLYDLDVLRPYEAGLFLLPESAEVRCWNETAKGLAQSVISVGGAGIDPPEESAQSEQSRELKAALASVNEWSEKLNEFVYSQTRRILEANKLPGIIGGDHSVPFGAIQAIAEKYPRFGILHLDAHSDTRRAFEGFTWSHASIMHNVLERIPHLHKLVQVGIRDLCEEEIQYTLTQKERISVFYDRDLNHRKFEGISWGQLCREIVALLPHEVWISFDIDGLDPRFCPHTGTPVPGGLDFQEANYLFATLVRSGRRIVGFDLNEVAPNLENPNDEWDANVGARMLYKLSAWTLASQSKAKLQI